MKRKFLALLVLLTMLVSATFFTTSVAFADTTSYTVKFMLDETTVYKTDTVEENKFITVPETPTKDDSVFNFWKLEDGTVFKFNKRVTADMVDENDELVLYADWEKLVFTVTFMVDGDVVSVQEVKKGTSAIAPNSVTCPEGKEFVRWDTNTEVITEDLTVSAVLRDIYYTVNVFADDEFVTSSKVKYGEDATFLNSLTLPEKEHYTIEGFIGETEKIVKNGNVYVNYVPVNYTVNYVANDAPFDEPVAVPYGEVTPMPLTTPEKAGHIFAGWFLNDEFYNFNTTISGDITLTAKFIPIEKPKYIVTFYDHNGEQYGGVQTITEGGSAITPGHPYREGYKFVGWNTDFSVVTENLDVYPMYSVNTYTVTVTDYTGVIAEIDVLYGESITFDSSLVNEQAGYEFIGFDGSFRNVTKDTVINAKYRAITYTVKFYNDNFRAVGGTQYVKMGESAKAPNVSKEGYVFVGWKNMDTDAMNDFDSISGDSNYVAIYEAITFTVTFIENGAILHTATVDYGKYAPFYNYLKDGYIFSGWFTDENLQIPFDFSTVVYKDITLYANWTENTALQSFSVIFYVDDKVYSEQVIPYNGKIVMPSNPEKLGYTFKGWDVDVRGFYFAGESISFTNENYVITAEFDAITYKVTYVYGRSLSGGDTPYKTTLYLHYGETPVFDGNVEKDGYTFIGWDKTVETVTKDVVITALYKINQYTVTFVDNDGNVIATQSVDYKSCAQILPTPKKEGHTFSHWINTTDYNRDFTFDYEVKYDVTIKAYFTINSYKLTYYIDGAKHKEITMTYDQVINPLTPPSYNPDMRLWLGWSEIPERMPARNVDIHGTTYEYKYYNLTLYIDGEVYREYSIREGKNTPNIYTPSNLPEYIIFKSWGEIPSVMPSEDVRIDAEIQKLGYYKLNFYLEGELFKVETVLEGKSIYNSNQYKDEIEAMFDETKIFNGWNFPENKMPAYDLRIDANITYKAYYNLNYYLNGVLYKSFTLLDGTKLEDTEYDLGTPTLPEYHIFQGWTKLPYNMPKEDLKIYGTSRELLEYTVTFKIGTEVYKEIKVREYSEIPLPEFPELDGTKWVTGWKAVPSTMPSYDIQIGAELIYLNDIVLEHREGYIDGVPVYYLDVKITGVVDFVAIKIMIDTKYPSEAILDDNYASYNPENHMLVYASGEVITEDTVIATFVGGTRLNWNTLGTFEIYTINDAGEIVKTVCYSNGNKH